MMKAEYRIEKETDEVTGEEYGLFMRDEFIASATRVNGGYCVQWHSTKTLSDLAAALRVFYAELQVDLLDKIDQKMFTVPGMYPIFNGDLSGAVMFAVGEAEEIAEQIGASTPKPYASLDDFMTNSDPVAQFFREGYKNNIGSVRIVTPYCDMFLEQYGRPIVLVSVMTDDRLNLADALVKPIQATTTSGEYASASCFPTALGDLVEKVLHKE